MHSGTIWRLAVPILLVFLVPAACGKTTPALTFPQLVAGAVNYNTQTVTVEAFYFDGFEISALAGALVQASAGGSRIVPRGQLVWVESGISQAVQSQLSTQTNTPTGYPEHFGKLRVSGQFATGGKYGHLDSYKYQIAVTAAAVLDWSPSSLISGDPHQSAISGNPEVINLNSVFWPVQLDQFSGSPYPDAFARGTLNLAGNYLRLQAFNDTTQSVLPVWPPGYSLRLENQIIVILDNNGQTVARTGTRIQLSGGLIDSATTAKYIGTTLPVDASGPYWLVARVIQ